MIWRVARKWLSATATSRGVVLRDNWGSVITGDIKGDVVLVNGERHALSLHIPRVRDPVAQNVGSLLTWRSRIPKKLHGRDAELAQLRSWCDEPAQIRVRILCGDGGTGKTRLAFELAEALRDAGWQAGQLVDPAQPVAFPIAGPGVLLIIDYPEQFAAALDNLLRTIKNSELPVPRLRLLLLSRNKDAMQASINRHVEPLHSPAMEIRSLDSADASWALFQDAWQEMGKLLVASSTPPLDERGFARWLAQDPSHAQPLILLSFALNLLHDPGATRLGRAEILQRLVQRERERITAEVVQHAATTRAAALQPEGVLLLKALAAIPGKLTASDIDQLAPDLAHRGITLPTAVALQRTTLWDRGVLPEMQPDLLAAVLVHEALRDWLPDPQIAGAWVWALLMIGAPSDEVLRGRLRRIARLSADRPRSLAGEPLPSSLVTALAQLVAQSDDKARHIDGLLNRDDLLEWTLQPLALAAVRRIAARLEQLAQQDFGKHAPELAGSLNNLSNRLAKAGERAASLAAIRRSTQIREQLAAENFAAHGADFATSLNNLAVQLSEVGDHPAGLAAIRRAVELREQLARADFTAYAPDLATSLNNLAVQLSDAGERASGLAAIRRAVEIREQLAQRDFAGYAADLAASLNNLAVQLSAAGDRPGGLAAIHRAVEIREQLARDNFAAYAPDLATSLNNLAVQLSEGGDRAGGLAAIRRAIEIRERLAHDNFAAYAVDLAVSLNNLSVQLAALGDRPGSLIAIRRAVAIRERLVQENFAAYAADLAVSLNNLAVDLSNMGDRDGGLAAIRRAVEIREQLTQQNFAVHAPDLAASLNNLSVQLSGQGNAAGGLVAIRRAIEIYERLVQESPAAYLPAFARSLNNLSVQLSKGGDSVAAQAAISRSVDLREQLAQQDFAVHAPDLAASLNNLAAQLLEAGDHATGIAIMRRAVAIREQLTRENFAGQAPDLAVSLYNLSLYLDDMDERPQALATLQRAIALIGPFAAPATEAHAWHESMQRRLAAWRETG